MKKVYNIIICAALLLAAMPLSAQSLQSDLPVLSLSHFERVEIDANIELTVVEATDGMGSRIVYDLSDNDPKKFKCEVSKKQVLTISQSKNSEGVSPIRATLYCRDLNDMIVARADVKIETPLTSTMVDLTLEDGAKLSAEFDCKDLLLTVSSDSQAELMGAAKYFTLFANSDAKCEARGLEVISARLVVSHGAMVAINAGERLEIEASTGAEAKYWGMPTILRTTKGMFGGEIKQQK